MAPSFWRLIQPLCVPSRILRSVSGWALFAAAGVVFLLCPAAARADIYDITFINVTFQGPCVGGGTCSEVVNGSALYDAVSQTGSNSTIQLSGSLNVLFDAYGTPPQCTAPGCLKPPVLYSTDTPSGFNPIELVPLLPTFDAPTPLPVLEGPNGTLLFVPFSCGGNQPACGMNGAFMGNGMTPFEVSSGTYTSVDVGPGPLPEPSSFRLL